MKVDDSSLFDSNNCMTELQVKIQRYPLIVVFITQVLVLVSLRNLLYVGEWVIEPWKFVFVQALLSSFVVSKIFKLPYWITTISFLLPVSIFVALNYFHGNSSIYGLAFLFLFLTFSNTFKDRVPLYLSNSVTKNALRKFVVNHGVKHFLDLGSGLGGVVRAMSSFEVQSFGVESAPVPWLISSFLSLIFRRGTIFRQSIWQTHLGNYDLVYAFLSPAVMEELWEKVQKEMKPGAVFVSNSFIVPNAKESEIMTLEDSRKTKLYIYKIH